MCAEPDDEPSTPSRAADRGSRRRRMRSVLTAPPVGWPGRLRKPTLQPLRDVRLPHALQNRLFRRYWLSQIVAMAGSWMQNTGSTLVVLSVTSSALAIGMINIVSAIPLLLFSLYGGVVADRLDRRRIIMSCQGFMGCLALLYAFLIITDQIQYWHILVIASLAGTSMSFELPAAQAFVAELVDRDDLPQALALNSTSFNTTRTIGPAIAGIVIGAFGTGAAFIINAFTLLAPMSVLVSLRAHLKPRPRAAQRQSGMAALREGVDHIRTHDDMLGLVLVQATFGFLVFPNLLVLMPLYVTEELGGADSWVALMISILGIGSLTGSISMLRGSRLEAAAGKRMRRAMAGLAIGLLWLALAPSPWVAVPGVLIAGFSFTTGNTQIMIRLQQLAPDAIRGRVMSVNGLAFNGVMPFATLTMALLSDVIGQPIVMIVCAIVLVVLCYRLWTRFLWKAFVAPPVLAAPLPATTG